MKREENKRVDWEPPKLTKLSQELAAAQCEPGSGFLADCTPTGNMPDSGNCYSGNDAA